MSFAAGLRCDIGGDSAAFQEMPQICRAWQAGGPLARGIAGAKGGCRGMV